MHRKSVLHTDRNVENRWSDILSDDKAMGYGIEQNEQMNTE